MRVSNSDFFEQDSFEFFAEGNENLIGSNFPIKNKLRALGLSCRTNFYGQSKWF